MSRPLRGVLVGAGFFARFQAEAWKRIPAAEIVAVVDSAPGKAEAFADEFGIPRAFESLTEALDRERPDFVDIATRPEAHLELTRAVASRGGHVICRRQRTGCVGETGPAEVHHSRIRRTRRLRHDEPTCSGRRSRTRHAGS